MSIKYEELVEKYGPELAQEMCDQGRGGEATIASVQSVRDRAEKVREVMEAKGPDFRPKCIGCGKRWLPPEGVDAQVSRCPACCREGSFDTPLVVVGAGDESAPMARAPVRGVGQDPEAEALRGQVKALKGGVLRLADILEHHSDAIVQLCDIVDRAGLVPGPMAREALHSMRGQALRTLDTARKILGGGAG